MISILLIQTKFNKTQQVISTYFVQAANDSHLVIRDAQGLELHLAMLHQNIVMSEFAAGQAETLRMMQQSMHKQLQHSPKATNQTIIMATGKAATPIEEQEQSLEQVLSTFSFEIAKVGVGTELEQHVIDWVRRLLYSNSLRTQVGRKELIEKPHLSN